MGILEEMILHPKLFLSKMQDIIVMVVLQKILRAQQMHINFARKIRKEYWKSHWIPIRSLFGMVFKLEVVLARIFSKMNKIENELITAFYFLVLRTEFFLHNFLFVNYPFMGYFYSSIFYVNDNFTNIFFYNIVRSNRHTCFV